MKKSTFAHIKTKDSFINYYYSYSELEFHGAYLIFQHYFFEGGKNLTNIDSNEYNFIQKIDKKNNRLELASSIFDDDCLNSTSSFFHFLGYIDNNFYFKDKEENYVYFGGSPQQIKENYNLYRFINKFIIMQHNIFL